MTQKTKHTPTPWNIEYGHMQSQSKIRYWQITDGQDAICHNQFCYAQDSDANAAHIVKCVNMHDELVERLRELLELTDDTENDADECESVFVAARETLKKAGAL